MTPERAWDTAAADVVFRTGRNTGPLVIGVEWQERDGAKRSIVLRLEVPEYGKGISVQVSPSTKASSEETITYMGGGI